nr:hypothetical protein [Nocardia carnea]
MSTAHPANSETANAAAPTGPQAQPPASSMRSTPTIYDLEVDTGTASIEACSAEIKAFLEGHSSNRAFDKLRAAADR